MQPTADDIRALQRYINPDSPGLLLDSNDIERWLDNRPACQPSPALTEWYSYWTETIDASTCYRDQVTVQSLCMQSLRRLQRLLSAEAALPYVETFAASQQSDEGEGTISLGDIYMAIDLLGGKRLPELGNARTEDFLTYVRALPARGLEDAITRLNKVTE